MGYRVRRFRKQDILKDIEGIIRTFPTTYASIERAGKGQDTLGEQMKIFQTLWSGDVKIRRITSTVQRLGMGQIDTGSISVLVAGEHDFRQGDFVRFRDGVNWASNHPKPLVPRLYQVQRIAAPFGAYMVLELNLYQQQQATV